MKYFLITLVLIVTSFQLIAQDEIVIAGSKKITKKLTPQQVIDSIEHHFPNAKSVQYYKIPASAAKNGWSVTEESTLDSDEEIDYYTIRFKRDDFRYYGLYKPDGTLVMSRYEEKINTLPPAITQSLKTLSQQYPGYTIAGETHFKRQDHSSNKEYYEITAKKGKERKKLFYAPDGTLMKVKG